MFDFLLQSDAWVAPASVVLFICCLVLGILFAFRSEKRREALQAEEHAAAVKEMHERGEADIYGRPVCLICGDVATQYVPIIDKAWFDHLPIVSWINRLYSVPWRYTVTVDIDSGRRLCTTHGTLAQEKMEHFAALLRSAHAAFNAEQQHKVAAMNRGGLERELRTVETELQEAFGNRPSLTGIHPPAPTQSTVGSSIALPPRTTQEESS